MLTFRDLNLFPTDDSSEVFVGWPVGRSPMYRAWADRETRLIATMMIDEFQERRKPSALADDKEIKVRIPLDYHIKLHTVKVVSGIPISDTVKDALEAYFADLKEEEKQAAEQVQ